MFRTQNIIPQMSNYSFIWQNLQWNEEQLLSRTSCDTTQKPGSIIKHTKYHRKWSLRLVGFYFVCCTQARIRQTQMKHKHPHTPNWYCCQERRYRHTMWVWGTLSAVFSPSKDLTGTPRDVHVTDITGNCILWKPIISLLNEQVSINRTLDSIKAPINLSIFVKRLPTVIWIHLGALI